MTPRATPTPIPALAPLERPPPEDAEDAEDAAGVEEEVLADDADVGFDAEAELAVDVGADEEDVVVSASAI